jgi:hypothetical protein
MNRYEIALRPQYLKECHTGRHTKWFEEGGRPCPKGAQHCTQPVYKCLYCGAYDYGEKGGPAYEECKNCTPLTAIIEDYKHDALENAYDVAVKDLQESEDKIFSS